MLKVGDIVRTVCEIRNNPVVAERRGWDPVPPNSIGVVVRVEQTSLNACYNRSGKGDVYVDVHLFDDAQASLGKRALSFRQFFKNSLNKT